jgi:threonyl-tRNA synthetase
VPYAREVAARLEAAKLRVAVDDSSNRMNQKIRTAQVQKVPYMLVVGDREAEAGAAAVRLRSEENLGAMPIADFLALVEPLVATRSLALK